MKKLLTILFCMLTVFVNATNYYVSNSGSDGASGISSGTAWATLNKVYTHGLSAGDTVFLKRGDTWNEKLKMPNSGSSGNQIVFAAYGTGADPVITGFTSVSSWTNVSGNIWESSSAVSTLSTLNMVTVNGSFQAIGRYPKLTDASSGYISTTTYTWAGGSAPITGSVKGVLAGSKDFTGGEVVMRKNHFIIDRATVTSQSYSSGSITANFSQPVTTVYSPANGYGFFFQNDADACTAQGDWYYNSSTKNIGMYSIETPTGVKVSTIDTLVDFNGKNYITIKGITVTGSNSLAFNTYNTSHNVIDGCTISFHGIDGISGYALYYTISNNTISYINNVGVYLNGGGNETITNNTLSYIGSVAGMGGSGDLQYVGIDDAGGNTTIQYNTIHDIGYTGIRFTHAANTISNNYIYNVCTVKDDGGAIYGGGATDFTGTVIDHNIIINSTGATDGTTGSNYGEGIYIDDAANNLTISNNSISQCGHGGLYTNAGSNIVYSGNTVFDCQYQLGTNTFSGTPSSLQLKNNILVARSSGQYCIYTQSASYYSGSDSNFYCKPIDESTAFNVNGVTKTLSQWQTFSGQDAHSKKSPKSITSVDSILLSYNPTSSSAEVALGASYIDLDSTVYPGYVTLAPYSSKILLYDKTINTSTITYPGLKFSGSTLHFGGAQCFRQFRIPAFFKKVPVMRFDFNPSKQIKTVNLGANYMDMTGKKLSVLSLAPFTSQVLLYDSPMTTLPVSLLYFNTSISGNILTVTWSTVTESNNDHFDIQTSTDGINWKTVKTVKSLAPNGNSSNKISYSTKIILQ